MSSLVEELIQTTGSENSLIGGILETLAGDYMDKVMDVTLVQFQPSSSVHPVTVTTLANLARTHPHQMTPFVKNLLSTTAQMLKSIKLSEMVLRLSFSNAITQFFEAILDYNSSQSTKPENRVKRETFNPEADVIYECLFSSWINAAKDRDSKVSVLAAISSTTTFISSALLKEKCSSFVLSILQMYKKFSVSLSSSLEITLCLSQMLELSNKRHPALLEPILDPIFNTLFQQICTIPDYNRPATVKNHNEILRCYNTMMINYPGKLVNGLLNKVDNSEERMRVGALTVIRHLLSLQTEVLGDRLTEIFDNISCKLGDNNRNVQKELAQIILMLGNHGAVTGQKGRDCIEFIIKLCATDSLGDMCGNILQLLTTGVPSVECLLWPHTLEYLVTPDYDGSVPAVARSLAHLAAGHPSDKVDWSQFQFCSSATILLARCLVLASVPHPGARGGHILRFLLKFSDNIHPNLGSVWQARFPLLLHYLEQHKDKVDLVQWQDWLLSVSVDSVREVGLEAWTQELVSALVTQLSLYPGDSKEKSFCVLLAGQMLTLVTQRQNVLDTLSSLFLVSVDRSPEDAESCSMAFGLCASTHLDLVISKLEMLLSNQSNKRLTSFFGLLRDRTYEEGQLRELAILLQCVGKAATKSQPVELSQHCNTMVTRFLAPTLSDCKDSAAIRESVLTAVSELAVALQQVLKLQPEFNLPLHDEMLQSAISILQNDSLALTSRQSALQCLTSLIELPPNISQVTRCSLLKACFSTIFSSFLEHESSKTEEYTVAKHLEQQLNTMVRKLHILIKELLRQDMEPSTLDEIFTMLEPWLKLDQDLSRELSVSIMHGALETYVKGVRLGVNSPSNFTPGPYMIGAIIPRCFDPSKRVRKISVDCLQQLLRILGLYEGLSSETIEQSLVQLQSVNVRCNAEDATSGKLDTNYVSQSLVSILGERIQHQHVLSLLDSLVETLLDTQMVSVTGCHQVLLGLVISRGSEVFQNIAGFVRKLHDKMVIMKMDETADMVGEVAEVVKQFAVHNTRGVVFSLVNMELPVDSETMMIWQCLAGDLRLAGEVVDVLLEIINHDHDKSVSQTQMVTQQHMIGATIALSLMLDTKKLEELARLELGVIVSALVMMMARGVGHQFSTRGSQLSLSKSDTCTKLDPVATSVTCLRSVFTSVGCASVASTLNTTTLSDYTCCVTLISKMMEAVCCHAPHHVSALVNSHVQYIDSSHVDSMRVAAVAVLSAACEHQCGGDQSLYKGLHKTLVCCSGDTMPLVRRLSLHGLAFISVDMGEDEVSTSVKVLVSGVDDDQCSTVSLTALRGLVKLLPHVSHDQLTTLVSSLALKVRPFFESSSEDHRAAAINIYSCLGGGDTGTSDTARTRYLDYISGVLLPILLHSNSPHEATRVACVETLNTIAKATKFKPLITLSSTFQKTKCLLLRIYCTRFPLKKRGGTS